MRRPLVILVALTLPACSGSDSSPTESTPTTASVTEACQTVADELPSGGYPDPAEWQAFASTLEDVEEPNRLTGPLDRLRDASQALADDPSGADLLDARSDLREAARDLDEECVAAGSDALS